MLTTSRLFWAVVLSFTVASASAANKAEKTDRVVDAVLEQETRASVTRRSDDLGDLICQSDRARWAAGYVKTADGWYLFDVLPSHDDRLREYEQRRGNEPLTPEQHLALANWCREQKLRDQERAHLWVLTSMNPHTPEWWKRLGYKNIGGMWLPSVDQHRMNSMQDDWGRNYDTWRTRIQALKSRLSSSSTAVQSAARSDLFKIDDLRALPALEYELGLQEPELAMEFVRWVQQKPRFATTAALTRLAIRVKSDAVRTAAIDVLRSRRQDQVLPILMAALVAPTEVKVYPSATPHETLNAGESILSATFERENWNGIQRSHYRAVLGSTSHITARQIVGYSFVPKQEYRYFDIDVDRLTETRRHEQTRLQQIEQRLSEENAHIQSENARVQVILSQLTGNTSLNTPQEWWNYWLGFTHSEAPTKPVVEVLEKETVVNPWAQVHVRIGFGTSCLPAGTSVFTRLGSRMIESLQIGDVVLAKDIDTGELSYKPVIRTTVRSPQPLVTLHTQDDSIRATLGHYFWVSGKGWRMAKEIKTGDRLHGAHGTATVTDVSPGGREAVYNLVVEGANTYFVGNGHLLSHDVTPPVPTDIVVPGLTAR